MALYILLSSWTHTGVSDIPLSILTVLLGPQRGECIRIMVSCCSYLVWVLSCHPSPEQIHDFHASEFGRMMVLGLWVGTCHIL